MILLVVAGIGLGASAVQWWNEGRIAKVRDQIARLVADRERIVAADTRQRRRMLAPFITELREVLTRELAFRATVRSELDAALEQARRVQQGTFTVLNSAALVQVFVELEQAVARLEAEEAYLRQIDALAEQGGEGVLSLPSAMSLPTDFPREGGLVQLNAGTKALHGYALSWEHGDVAEGEPVAVFAVDHRRQRARVCSARGGLLAAALSDGGGPIEATVRDRSAEGTLLDYRGVGLLLPAVSRRPSTLSPGDRLTVYPEPATVSAVLRAAREKEPARLLRVSTTRRVAGTREIWSPIALRFRPDQKEALLKAFDDLQAAGLEERPWRISLVGGGPSLEFAIGDVGLRMSVDAVIGCFVLDGVYRALERPETAIRLNAEIRAFQPGAEDSKEMDPALFAAFMEGLHAELSSQKRLLVERQAGLHLRKLSLIYRDQAAAERRAGSTGIFVTGTSKHQGRLAVEALAVDPELPAWLRSGEREGAPRLALASHTHQVDVTDIQVIDASAGAFRFVLAPGAALSSRECRSLTRLVQPSQGSQQEVLSAALEDALLGKFVSPSVRSMLLGSSGNVPHTITGAPAVLEAALAAPGGFAVWGPPGTGKTTLLVGLIQRFIDSWTGTQPPRILLAAPTHVAVNELMSRLLLERPDLESTLVRYVADETRSTPALARIEHRAIRERFLERVGSETGGDPALRAAWAQVLSDEEGKASLTKWLLAERRVHGATCVGMARREFGLTRQAFDLVIIDEAGKAFGAELFVPALRARKLILVGDHHQLPPTVTTDALDERVGYRLELDEVEELLRESYFGNLFQKLPAEAKGMLTVQYRMHPEIGRVVSQLFYDSRLESAPRCTERQRPSPFRSRVSFIDFTGVGAYRSKPGPLGVSQRNEFEASAAVELLEQLARSGSLQETLIVCPYEAQRSTVASLVARRLASQPVRVTTVDAVQGGEAAFVLLLMTRSHGPVQFLLDRHRMNVALSRAKEAVIIMGHGERLSAHDDSPVRRLLAIEGVRRVRVDPRAPNKVAAQLCNDLGRI